MQELRSISLERIPGTRVVAKPDTLNNLELPPETTLLRFAPDEAFIFPQLKTNTCVLILETEPDAILVSEAAFSGAWLPEDTALPLLERFAEWEMPAARPAFAQGAVAGVPAKLWFGDGRVLLLVLTPLAHELEGRLHE